MSINTYNIIVGTPHLEDRCENEGWPEIFTLFLDGDEIQLKLSRLGDLSTIGNESKQAQGILLAFSPVDNRRSFDALGPLWKEINDLTNSSTSSAQGYPLELALIAMNTKDSHNDSDWEVSREEFTSFAEQRDGTLYACGNDVMEDIFDILSSFGETVHRREKNFEEARMRRGPLNWRRLGDHESITVQDIRRIVDGDSGVSCF